MGSRSCRVEKRDRFEARDDGGPDVNNLIKCWGASVPLLASATAAYISKRPFRWHHNHDPYDLQRSAINKLSVVIRTEL